MRTGTATCFGQTVLLLVTATAYLIEPGTCFGQTAFLLVTATAYLDRVNHMHACPDWCRADQQSPARCTVLDRD